jgi:hypothetical protein
MSTQIVGECAGQLGRRLVLKLSLQAACLAFLISCRRHGDSRKIRIVVPSTLSGLFQIEGRASNVNGTPIREGEVLVLTMPSGKRYLGISSESPLLEWHEKEFVDESGNRLRSVASPSDLGPSERGVTTYGITGRSQLSWFAVGTRTELLDAQHLQSKLFLNGICDLP